MKPADVLAIVQRNAGAWPVPLLMGFAETESGRHDARGVLLGFDDRAFLMDHNGGSIGLFQVDLSTARDRGFAGTADALYDPETNVRVAVRQLDWIADTLRRHAAFGVQSLIAAYNEGVTNVLRGNPDPRYVGNVMAARERWRIALGEGVT